MKLKITKSFFSSKQAFDKKQRFFLATISNNKAIHNLPLETKVVVLNVIRRSGYTALEFKAICPFTNKKPPDSWRDDDWLTLISGLVPMHKHSCRWVSREDIKDVKPISEGNVIDFLNSQNSRELST